MNRSEQGGGRARWLRTLRFRLAAPLILVSTIMLVVLGLAVGEEADRLYVNRLSRELEYQTRQAAYVISTGDVPVAKTLDALANVSDTRLTLIAVDGVVLADTVSNPATMENHNSRPEVIAARSDGFGRSRRDSETVGEPYLYVAVPVPGGSGMVLRSAMPLDDVAALVRAAQRTIVAVLLVVFALFAFAVWWLAGRLSRPLHGLQDQANRVASGDLTARTGATGVEEIDAVGRSFNSMTRSLQDSRERLTQATLRLEAVMGGLAEGVVLTDAAGSVLLLNQAAESILGVDEADAFGAPFIQACRDHEMANVLTAALEDGKKAKATIRYGRRNLVLDVRGRIVTGPNERLGLVVLRDVTELSRLENVRREFVANVSHELRTPLTSIRAVVETLESGAIEEHDLAMDFLGRIVGESDRLNALVEDLLSLARLEAGRSPLEIGRYDISQVIGQGAERLRPQTERAGLALNIELDADLPVIELDRGRIEQVLMNLIHNAIKFTPEGGTITVGASANAEDVTVVVADTGVGIPAEEQSRLFERFYKSDRSRHSPGTGLGLSIAKHIVQLHGGVLTVTSAPGEGATFAFTLPIHGKRARKRARRQASGVL